MCEWLKEIKKGPYFGPDEMEDILDGRKTKTRRVIKNDEVLNSLNHPEQSDVTNAVVECADNGELIPVTAYAPYQPNEIYYIREPVRYGDWPTSPFSYTVYEADGMYARVNNGYLRWCNENGSERKVERLSGASMPQRYARRFALITDVSVEKLQNVGYDDVVAMGVPEKDILNKCPSPVAFPPGSCDEGDVHQILDMVARTFYRDMWTDKHSEESWENNPWVWDCDFEVLTKEDAKEKVRDNE